ncbi:uncharacterized protein MONBRDRAFT_11061 [Monosiga brevicollis MX1]|uniref:Uncharacterized protein n=1 Tax=Monosiga brevicollis TaxID=81824 RepID=A9V837_MONBE|nr:uncharacterized protein MONBRDRAFT_11061 [Monosiga brevicollis MX1]EDQ86201.1 predicted protein [Monosiga brevicollis MX1]|eukprot:XP_001748871.1 hypothetical protein [Monosiga brevicollis MX1]
MKRALTALAAASLVLFLAVPGCRALDVHVQSDYNYTDSCLDSPLTIHVNFSAYNGTLRFPNLATTTAKLTLVIQEGSTTILLPQLTSAQGIEFFVKANGLIFSLQAPVLAAVIGNIYFDIETSSGFAEPVVFPNLTSVNGNVEANVRNAIVDHPPRFPVLSSIYGNLVIKSAGTRAALGTDGQGLSLLTGLPASQGLLTHAPSPTFISFKKPRPLTFNSRSYALCAAAAVTSIVVTIEASCHAGRSFNMQPSMSSQSCSAVITLAPRGCSHVNSLLAYSALGRLNMFIRNLDIDYVCGLIVLLPRLKQGDEKWDR